VTTVREDQLFSVLAQRTPVLNGLLIYGDDQSAAESIASKVTVGISALSATPEAALHLDSGRLTSDPAKLRDEFQAMSLLGERRVIIVSGVGEAGLKSIQPLLDANFVGNFVILIAGSLTKGSKLRSAVEQASRFLVLPLYEARQQDLEASLMGVMKQYGLTLDDDARLQFFELVGNDRMIVVQEASKLALYAMTHKQVSREDVIAACGAVSEMGVSELIDDVLRGKVEAIESMSAASGEDANTLRNCLPLMAYHLSQLQSLHQDRAHGKSTDAAIASARPPIHYSRRSSYERQLKLLDANRIEKFQSSIEQLTLASRSTPELSTSLVGRGLISIAREVRSLSAQ
jgi:DNA polymerase III subunit delta